MLVAFKAILWMFTRVSLNLIWLSIRSSTDYYYSFLSPCKICYFSYNSELAYPYFCFKFSWVISFFSIVFLMIYGKFLWSDQWHLFVQILQFPSLPIATHFSLSSLSLKSQSSWHVLLQLRHVVVLFLVLIYSNLGSSIHEVKF